MEGRERLGRWVPGLALVRRQRGAALRRDVAAGAVLAALLVPQGMAYAELAGVPPVTGLYATLVPLAVYVRASGLRSRCRCRTSSAARGAPTTPCSAASTT